jgi:hypothetical protein
MADRGFLHDELIGVGSNVYMNCDTVQIGANTKANTTGFYGKFVGNGSLLTNIPQPNVAPGGSNTHVLVNDSGVTNGSDGLTFNKTTNTLAVGNTLTANVVIANTANIVAVTINALSVNVASGNTADFLSITANTLSVNALSLGNTTVNVFANSTLIKIANSTLISNLTPGLLLIGTSSVNSTMFAAGANVLIDTEKLSFGNSTVNATINSTLTSIRNATDIANLSASQLLIGTSSVNSTMVALGANVLLSTSLVHVGNNTVNATVNSTAFALNGVALSSGGGITEITSGSLPAAATLDITDIPSTFAYLVLFLDGISSGTNTRQPLVQVDSDNGASFDTTVGNYSGYTVSHVPAVAAKALASLIESVNESGGVTWDIVLILHNYQGGTFPLAQFQVRNGQGGTARYTGQCMYAGTLSPINALRILWSGSGDFDAGTYALYGVS